MNKVSSVIRATYLLLNISVQVMDTRSQLQNKQIAIQRIKEKIASLHEIEKSQMLHHNWINQSQIAHGNPIRVFEGIKFTKKLKSRITCKPASIYKKILFYFFSAFTIDLVNTTTATTIKPIPKPIKVSFNVLFHVGRI